MFPFFDLRNLSYLKLSFNHEFNKLSNTSSFYVFVALVTWTFQQILNFLFGPCGSIKLKRVLREEMTHLWKTTLSQNHYPAPHYRWDSCYNPMHNIKTGLNFPHSFFSMTLHWCGINFYKIYYQFQRLKWTSCYLRSMLCHWTML